MAANSNALCFQHKLSAYLIQVELTFKIIIANYSVSRILFVQTSIYMLVELKKVSVVICSSLDFFEIIWTNLQINYHLFSLNKLFNLILIIQIKRRIRLIINCLD